MLIASMTVGPWQANCYVLAAEGATAALVIDPGVGAAAPVAAMLAERGWDLAGVLATHGHVDHIADAARLANQAGVPLWLHRGDDFMLTRPSAGLGPEAAPLLRQLLGADGLPEPDTLVDLARVAVVEAAGLSLDVLPAPGHTPGCVLYRLDGGEARPVVFSGDVLFAGSIGRTDLPGGDKAAMAATLRGVVASLPAQTRVLPGHGPATTMADEFVANPFLRPIHLKGASS